jgi:NADPH:quinone reductase-like Zn-dependent oxidoreductase
VIDYTKEDFTETGERYDIIFDAVGKLSKMNRKKELAQNGTHMSVHDKLEKESIKTLVFLKKLAEAGNVTPAIDRIYPLEQLVEAHRYVDNSHKKEHVVITIEQNNKT